MKAASSLKPCRRNRDWYQIWQFINPKQVNHKKTTFMREVEHPLDGAVICPDALPGHGSVQPEFGPPPWRRDLEPWTQVTIHVGGEKQMPWTI